MRTILTTLCLLGAFGTPAQAITYSDQTTFLATLEVSTVIDTSSFIGNTTSGINASLSTGAFFGPDASVRNDDLILNGAGFHGTTTPHVGINFNSIVNAVGVTSNAIDGGRILLYSGLNGTGDLLSTTAFGGGSSASFTGVADAFPARSVIFTCDFNSDLKCGLRDPVFGFDTAFAAQVPLPASVSFLLAGIAGLLGLRRRG